LYGHLSVRNYACLLEQATIKTLVWWRLYGFTTDNPGVWVRSNMWVRSKAGFVEIRESLGDERKIAALGVHLRRHVTGLGVAINYKTPVMGPAETNPWGRIVPCGLGEHGVTSMSHEIPLSNTIDDNTDDNKRLKKLAEIWWSQFQKLLDIREGAAQMVEGHDMDWTMESLSAGFKGDDVSIEAQPLSGLET
jgi:lipoyl(octanoyl) transferase